MLATGTHRVPSGGGAIWGAYIVHLNPCLQSCNERLHSWVSAASGEQISPQLGSFVSLPSVPEICAVGCSDVVKVGAMEVLPVDVVPVDWKWILVELASFGGFASPLQAAINRAAMPLAIRADALIMIHAVTDLGLIGG